MLQQHRLGDLLADFHDGIQAGQRILKNHGQIVPPEGAKRLFIQLQQIPAIV